tara:strand:+ start:137 stop:505 length:369 start_codon:yes stop_codon:yes gene_type:complete
VEGAEAITQAAWEHGNDPVHEIGGIASNACFPIKWRICLHVMGDVGDMNPEFPSLSSDSLKGKGVVKIQSGGRVDADDRVVTAVSTAGSVLLFDMRAKFIGFAEDVLWKRFTEGGSRLEAGL